MYRISTVYVPYINRISTVADGGKISVNYELYVISDKVCCVRE